MDLPEAPEKAPRPPLQPVDPYSRYGPKAEISHIFRSPDKRPPKELSLAFLGLTFVPLLGFFIGVGLVYLVYFSFPQEVFFFQNLCLLSQSCLKYLPSLLRLLDMRTYFRVVYGHVYITIT